MLHAKYLKGPKFFNILSKKSNDEEIGYLKKSALSSKPIATATQRQINQITSL